LLKNSFPTLDFRSKEVQKKAESFIAPIIMKGFQQGTDLTSMAKSLEIPINPEFEKLVLNEGAR
jgi:hypothetical protein